MLSKISTSNLAGLGGLLRFEGSIWQAGQRLPETVAQGDTQYVYM
jgi:hypothetical protein